MNITTENTAGVKGGYIEGRKSGLRYSRINLVAGKIGNALIGNMITRKRWKVNFLKNGLRKYF